MSAVYTTVQEIWRTGGEQGLGSRWNPDPHLQADSCYTKNNNTISLKEWTKRNYRDRSRKRVSSVVVHPRPFSVSGNSSPTLGGWSSFGFVTLGGWSSFGFVISGDGDVALSAARLAPPAYLWPGQRQQAVCWQGAADGGLVHDGREAVTAVELPGDVTVIVLKNRRHSPTKLVQTLQTQTLNWSKHRSLSWISLLSHLTPEDPYKSFTCLSPCLPWIST